MSSSCIVCFLALELTMYIRYPTLQHTMQLDGVYGVTDDGFSVIKYEYPVVSTAEKTDLAQVLDNFEHDIKQENDGNTDIPSPKRATDNDNRRVALTSSVAKAYDKETGEVAAMKKVYLRLPKCPLSGRHLSSNTKNWQGEDYKTSPTQDEGGKMKGRFEFAVHDDAAPDGTKLPGFRYYVVWEIQVAGDDFTANNFNRTPPKKAALSQSEKLAATLRKAGVAVPRGA